MMKRRISVYRKWITGAVGLALLTSSGGLVQRASAQPAPRQTMPDWEKMSPEQLRETLQNLPPEQQEQMQQMFQMLQMLTPQQRQQMLQNLPADQQEKFQIAQEWMQDHLEQQRWDWIRQTLTASNFTDTTVQDAVIEFMQTQEKARQPLRKTEQDLANSLVEANATDEEYKKQLADFRDQMKKDDDRYKQDLAALDAKIKFSTQPRLEALLTVLGVVGQETPTLGGLGTLFPKSPMAKPIDAD